MRSPIQRLANALPVLVAMFMPAVAFGSGFIGGGGGGVSSASMDSAFGSTRGAILYRGSGGWTILAPGLPGSNYVLTNTGANSDPAWTLGGTTLDLQVESIGIGTPASGAKGQLTFAGSTSGSQTWKVPATGATGLMVFPAAHGAAGTVLTDAAGDGTLSWASAGGASINPTTTIITIGNGLGSVKNIVGPSDQDVWVAAGAGQNAILSNNTGNGYFRVDTSSSCSVASNGNLAVWDGTHFYASSTASLGIAGASWSKLFLDYTNTGTVGAVTINKASGRCNIAAAGTQVTVTDSLVTAASHVQAWCSTNDTTAFVQNVVPAAGSFTITLGAAATAQTSIDFVVIGAD